MVFRPLLVLTFISLAGCGQSRAPNESQIAAHVNNGEISVHQVQAVLLRQPRLAGATPETAPAQVLEVLIDQELAAQAAVKQGLESDPDTVQALQLARRETLARVYHERVAAKASLPSSDEIDRYYDSHPELFSQRRLYTLQEFVAEADATQVLKLREWVQQSRSSEAMALALQDLGVRYTTRQFVQAAEDIPLALLHELAKTESGQSIFVPGAAGARVFRVVQALHAPVDRRTAADAIAKFLVAEQKRRQVTAAMSELRKESKVQYVGAFEKASAASSPQSGARVASAPR